MSFPRVHTLAAMCAMPGSSMMVVDMCDVHGQVRSDIHAALHAPLLPVSDGAEVRGVLLISCNIIHVVVVG